MASFFKRLSRSKSADISGDPGYHGGYVEGDLVNKKRSNSTKERNGSDSKSEKKQQEHINAVMNDHGLLRSPMKYPTFTCHYLGRMPASGEFGRENVEGPVDSLCKLRERQKLPRVVMKFDKDGLHVREISGPFSKPKREGIHQFVPLHHVSYGVGSLMHPYVFACITRIMDDPDDTGNQVLVLHAFLCDKPETTRSITYWQLQSYIEAYEELKKKKLLRKMRKKARMRAKLEELDNISTHTTTTTLSNGSQESRKIEDEPLTEKGIENKDEKDTEKTQESRKIEDEPLTEKGIGNKDEKDTEKTQLPDVTNIAEKPDSETKNVPIKSETKANTDKEQIGDEQKDDTEKDNCEPDEDEEDDEADEQEEGGEQEKEATKGENGETEGAQGDEVFHQSAGKNPRDIAFERRILELQHMFDMDSDELKQLLLRDNPTIKTAESGDEMRPNWRWLERDVLLQLEQSEPAFYGQMGLDIEDGRETATCICML